MKDNKLINLPETAPANAALIPSFFWRQQGNRHRIDNDASKGRIREGEIQL